MSWRSAFASAGLALALAGCGFHPLYGREGASGLPTEKLAQVRVTQIGDRLGVIMTDELRDTLNPAALSVTPKYRLNVGLNELSYDEGIRADGTSSRTLINLGATWTLTSISGSKTLLTGVTHEVSSFDIVSNDYANVVSRRTQEERLVHEASAEILSRLAAYLRKSS